MITARLFCLCITLVAGSAKAELETVDMTPKLENLNKQIAANGEDSQAYMNRAYTLALLGRKTEARVLAGAH